MGNKEKTNQNRIKKRGIFGCISCESYYRHGSMLSERKNGVSMKFGKIYCIFPKKAIKLDARKSHVKVPDDCPRHSVPICYRVYTPKKRSSSTDADTGNAGRFWRVYAGNVSMITRMHLFGDGSYTTLDYTDGFLWDNGVHIHKLEKNDVVVREDGFSIKVWQWDGRLFDVLSEFDETGIKKKPKQKEKKADMSEKI